MITTRGTPPSPRFNGGVLHGDSHNYSAVHLRLPASVDGCVEERPLCNVGAHHLRWSDRPGQVTCEECRELMRHPLVMWDQAWSSDTIVLAVKEDSEHGNSYWAATELSQHRLIACNCPTVFSEKEYDLVLSRVAGQGFCLETPAD